MRPAILTATKSLDANAGSFRYSGPRRPPSFSIGLWAFRTVPIAAQDLTNSAATGWSVDRLSSSLPSFDKHSSSWRSLEEVADRIFSGVKPGATEAFVISSEVAAKWARENSSTSRIARPFFRGQDLHRYAFDFPSDCILLINNEADFRCVPQIRKHIEQHRDILEGRDEVRRGSTPWYALRPCDYYEVFSESLIAWPDTAKESRFCILPAGSVIGNTAFCIRSNELWLLPILNSKIGWRLISLVCQSRDERAGLLRYRLLPQFMGKFPVPNIDDSQAAWLARIATDPALHTEEVEESVRSLYSDVGISL